MADFYVPLATNVFSDLNQQIAAGPPKPDLSFISNALDNYKAGGDIRQQIGLRDMFKDGVPTTANGAPDYSQISKQLLQIGGAGQVQNSIGLGNYQLGRDILMGGNGGQPIAPPSSATAVPTTAPSNNPGNIENGPFSRSQPGYQPTSSRFASFDTPQSGFSAADKLIQGYGNKGVTTPAAIAARWAPAGDGSNNPQQYGAFIAQQLGVSPDTPLDLSDTAVRQKVVQAISKFEGNGRMLPQGQTFAQSGPPTSPQAPPQNPNAQPGMDQATADRYEQAANVMYQKAQAAALINPAMSSTLKAQGDAYMKQAEIIRGAIAKNSETIPEQKQYSQAVQQGYKGTFAQWQADQAGAKKEAETQVASLGKLADSGIEAKGRIAQLDAIDQLGQKVAYGVVPKIQSFLGEHGIDTKGLSDIQAYERAIDFMAPQLRPVGSGRLMQQELAAFKASLGGLMTTPEGRKISLANLKLISQYGAQVGQIAADTTLSPSQRFEKIYSMPPPKLNLDVPKGSASGPAPGTVINGFRFNGGNPNDQKSWSPLEQHS